jgi:hypothetical protein
METPEPEEFLTVAGCKPDRASPSGDNFLTNVTGTVQF